MHLCQHFRRNFVIGCPQSTILTAHRLKEERINKQKLSTPPINKNMFKWKTKPLWTHSVIHQQIFHDKVGNYGLHRWRKLIRSQHGYVTQRNEWSNQLLRDISVQTTRQRLQRRGGAGREREILTLICWWRTHQKIHSPFLTERAARQHLMNRNNRTFIHAVTQSANKVRSEQYVQSCRHKSWVSDNDDNFFF